VSTPDLLAALGPVLRALGDLGVRHFVGGSIASSAHGVARASIDGDVVAELGPAHVAPLVAALRDTYDVPEERVREAVACRASFNVIHLDTMLKVDVFVSRDRPFDRRPSNGHDPRRSRAPAARPSRSARQRTGETCKNETGSCSRHWDEGRTSRPLAPRSVPHLQPGGGTYGSLVASSIP
jgi:hypothetical protein